MKIFKPRRNIEKADLFRVEYLCYLNDGKVESREFNTAKSLSQWVERNTNEISFGILELRRLARINGEWEPYTTIGKKTITLSDLEMIVANLKYDALKASEN